MQAGSDVADAVARTVHQEERFLAVCLRALKVE